MFSLGSWCFPKLFVVISRLLQFFLLFCVFTKLSCRLQANNPSNSSIHQKCQEGRLHLLLAYESNCYPKGCAAPGQVQCQCNTRGSLSKLKRAPPQAKINVTSKSPVGDISVVTLIRTDTTLDHSQKAEKVWVLLLSGCACACGCVQVVCFRGGWFGAAVGRPSAGNTCTAVRVIVGPKPP